MSAVCPSEKRLEALKAKAVQMWPEWSREAFAGLPQDLARTVSGLCLLVAQQMEPDDIEAWQECSGMLHGYAEAPPEKMAEILGLPGAERDAFRILEALESLESTAVDVRPDPRPGRKPGSVVWKFTSVVTWADIILEKKTGEPEQVRFTICPELTGLIIRTFFLGEKSPEARVEPYVPATLEEALAELYRKNGEEW